MHRVRVGSPVAQHCSLSAAAAPQQHSTTPATSAQLLRAACGTTRLPAAPTMAHAQATEQGLQRKALPTFPPQPFR